MIQLFAIIATFPFGGTFGASFVPGLGPLWSLGCRRPCRSGYCPVWLWWTDIPQCLLCLLYAANGSCAVSLHGTQLLLCVLITQFIQFKHILFPKLYTWKWGQATSSKNIRYVLDTVLHLYALKLADMNI